MTEQSYTELEIKLTQVSCRLEAISERLDELISKDKAATSQISMPYWLFAMLILVSVLGVQAVPIVKSILVSERGTVTTIAIPAIEEQNEKTTNH